MMVGIQINKSLPVASNVGKHTNDFNLVTTCVLETSTCSTHQQNTRRKMGNHIQQQHMAPKKKSRGMGVSKQELFALLDIIEKHLPVAQNDWDLVEADHEAMYPDSLRTRDSLKRKFVSLYRIKVPTGDPKCPPEVRRAKFILEDIKKRLTYLKAKKILKLGVKKDRIQYHQQQDTLGMQMATVLVLPGVTVILMATETIYQEERTTKTKVRR